MKQWGRYILLNGGGVMWQRRWFWKWFQNYENYDNCLNVQRGKVNKKLAELEEEVSKLRDLERKKKAIIDEVNKSRGCDKDCGYEQRREFGFFDFFRTSIKDIPSAPKQYADIVQYFKGKGQMVTAADAADELGLQLKGVGGHDVDYSEGEQTKSPYAGSSQTVMVRSHPITPESNNQQKKQKQQQGQQNGQQW